MAKLIPVGADKSDDVGFSRMADRCRDTEVEISIGDWLQLSARAPSSGFLDDILTTHIAFVYF